MPNCYVSEFRDAGRMINLKHFSYKVLSKNYLSRSEDLEDYEKAYRFWHSTWKDVFTSVGSPEALVVDDFYRSDFIPVIKYEGQVVGSSCHTVFNMVNPCLKEMRYFSIFTPEAHEWIAGHSPSLTMSMEFLCVHREYSKKYLGFSLAEVLLQLSFNLMVEKDIDLTLGVAVRAAGVDKLTQNLGGAVIGRDVKRGNLSCDLVANSKNTVLANHPDWNVDQFIKRMWQERQYAMPHSIPLKKVG